MTLTIMEAELLINFKEMSEADRRWLAGYAEHLAQSQREVEAAARRLMPRLRLVMGGQKSA